MANLLNSYVEKENLLKQLQEELSKMEGDERLQHELEFKSRLEDLMKEFNKTAQDVLALLEPQAPKSSKPESGEPSRRRKRKLKIYKNPNTGEVVETRGGNQKTLKAWKEEYGEETVESWLERVED